MFEENNFNDINITSMNMSNPDYMDSMNGMSSMNSCCAPVVPSPCQPIYECPRERCCHREICHEVRHIVPINTRVINHHVYKHTYIPSYTCCEENEVSNIYENPCNF